MGDEPAITRLLNQWSAGDEVAEAALTPLVYDELQRVAKRLFRGEKDSHTLQPTALVHEAFIRLIDVDVTWQDRAHFYALAARLMRRLFVDHAVARNAMKRGGGALRVTFDEASVKGQSADAGLIELEEALQALAALDPRKAQLIELQYFGGLSFREMAAVTGLSSSTLDRDLRLARAWLKDALSKK